MVDRRARRIEYFLAAGLLAVVVLIFWQKIFLEDFTSDGAEAYFISKTILSHGVPHWDLENGHFGFDLNFMLFGYPNAALMLIIGPVEAAVRLPFLVYLLACYVLMLRMASSESHESPSRVRLLGAVSLAIFLLFLALLYGYYATYNPYLADLAEPTAIDLFLSMLMLGAILSLQSGRYPALVAICLGMMLSLPSGFPLTVFLFGTAIALYVDRRRELLVSGAVIVALWVLVQFLFAMYQHYVPMGSTQYTTGTLLRRARVALNGLGPEDIYFYMKYAILSVGVLPALCLVFYSRLDRLSKLLVVMSVLYCGLMLMTGRMMLHYFVPFSVLSPVAFVRYCQSPRSGSRVGSGQLLLWLATLLVLIAVIFPVDREPYARSSEFGRRTLMAFDSDGQAIGKANEVANHYLVRHASRAFQDKNWSLGSWEWVYYARLGRDARIDDGIDYVVSDAALEPDGFTLLYRVGDTFFYVRDVAQFIEQLRSAPEDDFRPALLADTRYFKSYDTKYVERTIRAYTATAEQLSLLPDDSERQKMMAYLSNRIRDLRSYMEAQGRN